MSIKIGAVYIVLLKYGPAMLFGLLSYKFFFRFEMVNASCDFCNNNYRTNPHIGYFKVTASLKTSLRLREGAGLNTICGEHFDILQSGRVAKDARTVFFLGQSVASHDHNYFCDSTGENLGEYDGKIFKGVFLVY